MQIGAAPSISPCRLTTENTAVEAEPTIFIIDDDPAVRQALTVLVRSMHLRAEAYDSAQQFLDAFDPSRPGCLLLDVRMPGISGLDLLEQLSRDEVPCRPLSCRPTATCRWSSGP